MKPIPSTIALMLTLTATTPTAAGELEVGAAAGGGVFLQGDGAPPLCCGERDEWTGGLGAAEARVGARFDGFALVLGLGLVGVSTDDADDGARSYSDVFPTARLGAEARFGSDRWRGRAGLGGGLAFEALSVSIHGGVERAISDLWVGAEIRGEAIVLSGSAWSVMATVWY